MKPLPTSRGRWADGSSFEFKQPEKSPANKLSSISKAKARRQSTLLKRLDIAMQDIPMSPKSPAMRRTRRMSMARGSTIPKVPRKIPMAKNSSTSSKSSSFKSSATSSSSLTEANSAEARSESWIDKISAPEVFYKATPVSPKLTGAQRRKSYTAATSASLAIKINNSGEKRALEESTPAPAAKKRNTSASQMRSKIPTPTNAAQPSKTAANKMTGISRSRSASKQTRSNVTSKSDVKRPESPVKTLRMTRSKSSNSTRTAKSSKSPKSAKSSKSPKAAKSSKSPKAAKSSKSPKAAKSSSKLASPPKPIADDPTKSEQSPVMEAPSTESKKSAAKSRKTPTRSKSTKTPKKMQSPVKSKKASPAKSKKTPKSTKKKAAAPKESSSPRTPSPQKAVTPDGSPVLVRNSRLTRSAKRLPAKQTAARKSPGTVTWQKKLKESQPTVSVVNISSSATLAQALSKPGTPKATVSPNTFKSLVKASKCNPFTPKPEAEPFKLLKQNFRQKINHEMHDKKDSPKVCEKLIDPRVSTVSTPTRALLSEAGFIPGDTPVSAVKIPSTPKSARSYQSLSRSARMVASARRNMNVSRDLSQTPLATPFFSTPAPTSPLNSSQMTDSSSADRHNDSTVSPDASTAELSTESLSDSRCESTDGEPIVDGPPQEKENEKPSKSLCHLM